MVCICGAVDAHTESPGANNLIVDKPAQEKRKISRWPLRPVLECHLDKPFEIKLEIYHTGYRWEASYDKDSLRLDSVSPNYE